VSQAAHAHGPRANALAAWATQLAPTEEELELARRSLLDTLAVARAARAEHLTDIARELGAGGQLAVAAHVLDYDDLHIPSTSHVSAVCVAAALAAGGDARAYLAGAGVMARLGEQLGFGHYEAGWHATCTAGAPAAAVAAGVAAGLDSERLATAIALAIPAAGGNHQAFGTHAKALQVGFAVDAGMRAAALAAAGASADPAALDRWLTLVGGGDSPLPADGPAVPGGLAIKLFPCCYALQRPIHAAIEALAGEQLQHEQIAAVLVSAPEATLTPLVHHRPQSGLQGKFSLEYALSACLLDGRPGLASFTDSAVARPTAQAILRRVEVSGQPGDGGLLSGEVTVEIRLHDGGRRYAAVTLPPGAPTRPPTESELASKLADCAGSDAAALAALTWERAAVEAPALIAGHAQP
jgi:2-methylcitrate dehydratase PrpD